MPSRRTPTRCACGECYKDFRLGMSFADVRHMLFDQEDPARPGWWRQKRRHSVLGLMRELKLKAWDAVHGHCEQLFEQSA